MARVHHNIGTVLKGQSLGKLRTTSLRPSQASLEPVKAGPEFLQSIRGLFGSFNIVYSVSWKPVFKGTPLSLAVPVTSQSSHVSYPFVSDFLAVSFWSWQTCLDNWDYITKALVLVMGWNHSNKSTFIMALGKSQACSRERTFYRFFVFLRAKVWFLPTTIVNAYMGFRENGASSLL